MHKFLSMIFFSVAAFSIGNTNAIANDDFCPDKESFIHAITPHAQEIIAGKSFKFSVGSVSHPQEKYSWEFVSGTQTIHKDYRNDAILVSLIKDANSREFKYDMYGKHLCFAKFEPKTGIALSFGVKREDAE